MCIYFNRNHHHCFKNFRHTLLFVQFFLWPVSTELNIIIACAWLLKYFRHLIISETREWCAKKKKEQPEKIKKQMILSATLSMNKLMGGRGVRSVSKVVCKRSDSRWQARYRPPGNVSVLPMASSPLHLFIHLRFLLVLIYSKNILLIVQSLWLLLDLHLSC